MSSLSTSIAQATLDTTPITIWDRSVAGTKAWGVTYFKNLSTSAGDVYLTLTGSPLSLPIVLNPGDIIPLRLAGGITKVTAVAASTATMNYGPQTDGSPLPIFDNFSPAG
jgi:hypothetical protein